MSKEQSATLRDKAISGVTWSAIERLGQQGCSFAVQLVLARLLAPEEFGLVAMVIVFIAMSTMIIDAGFGRALIQKKNVDKVDLSSVFYFNVFVSCLMVCVWWLSAPMIALFYGQPILETVLQVLSIGLFLDSLSVVHRVWISKQLMFKKLFWVSFPATLISGLFGGYLAFNGGGVWALVAQSLTFKLLCAILFWFLSGWRPALLFDFSRLRSMFPYGSRLALSGLLDAGFQNAYFLVIGKFFPVVEVGYFQRARSFQQFPVQSFQSIFSRVAFPLFASIQDDPERMKRGMRKALQITCLVVFAGMALLGAIAEPLLIVLIGAKWLPSGPYLQWLCLLGAMYPLHSMNVNLLASIGRSDLFLRLEVIKKSLIAVNIAVTFQFGVQAMIYGMIVTSLFALLVNTHYTKKLIHYGFIEQLTDVFRILIVGLFVFCASFTIMCASPLMTLVVRCLVAGGVFLLCVPLLSESLKDELKRYIVRLPYFSN